MQRSNLISPRDRLQSSRLNPLASSFRPMGYADWGNTGTANENVSATEHTVSPRDLMSLNLNLTHTFGTAVTSDPSQVAAHMRSTQNATNTTRGTVPFTPTDCLRAFGMSQQGANQALGMSSEQQALAGPPSFTNSTDGTDKYQYKQRAAALVQMVQNGECESEPLVRPKSPKSRQVLPVFVPSRFTSSHARLKAEAIDGKEVIKSKDYTDRYLYLQPQPHLPPWFSGVIQGKNWPTTEQALAAIPIHALWRFTAPSVAGVIKVSDFPYATTKAEIVAFLGRTAKIVSQPRGSSWYATHIILERESGKTNECYVEIDTPGDAEFTVRQFQKRSRGGRLPKIGDRDVKVEVSTQEALMTALFPRTKNIRWVGAIPVKIEETEPYYPNKTVAGFQGYFSQEESVMMMKYGNSPERNPFISRNPTRAVENMISLVHKYPWYEPGLISIAERRRIYDTTRSLTIALINQLSGESLPDDPFTVHRNPRQQTPGLLHELVVAALTCPGFSEAQKHVLVRDLNNFGYGQMAATQNVAVPLGGSHKFGTVWPFMALSILPGTDMRLVEFYGSLFIESAMKRMSVQTNRNDIELGHPMGWPPVDFGNDLSKAEDFTLEQLANLEYHGIEQMIKQTLPEPEVYDYPDEEYETQQRLLSA